MTRNLHLFGGCVIALALACVAAPAFAAPQLASMSAGPSGIEWQPNLDGVGLVLTVSGPDGFYMTQEAGPGSGVSFGVFGSDGNFRPAGSYAWEISAVVVAPDAPGREAGGEAPAAGLQKAGKLPSGPLVQSGYFRIADGAILQGGEEEAIPARPAGNRLGAKDQVILDDLIVDGSICAGFDCVNGESFGFDTLRLKENNLRIKAQDTSTSASFPTNDWQITFNETSNGGANKFSIDDIDGGRTPFTIEAGAPSHSLYVEDGGRIGIGTSTPVVNIHVKTGNTPTLRLEQDGSSGFTAQTWDVAGNEANFFIRDATSGSTLPFRIFPGAPSNALTVEGSTGDIGINTTSPEDDLHVRVTGSNGGVLIRSDSNLPQLTLDNDAVASDDGNWRFRVNSVGNFVFIHADTDSTTPFVVAPETSTNLLMLSGNTVAVDGNITATGTITPDYVFEPDFPLESIAEHAKSMWANKHLPAVGPALIREDGKHVFNLSVHTFGMLEELEKAHIYIDQLNQKLEVKEAAISELSERLARIEASLAAAEN